MILIGKAKSEMVKNVDEKSNTRLGELLATRMEEKGLSIRDLSVKLDITYEHVRRLARGEGIPSKWVLKSLCEILDIPYKEAEELATADKLEKKYGDIPLRLMGQDPSLEPLQRIWTNLTEDQKQNLIDTAKSMVKRNRAAKAS